MRKLLALTIVGLVGCGSSGGVVNPPISPPVATINYTALGASESVGFNASVSCDSAANRTATQPLASNPLDCPGGTATVPQIARSLAGSGPVRLVNLALSGGLIGPSMQQLRNTIATGGAASSLLNDQLPLLPTDTTLVTLVTGSNDTNVITLAAAQVAVSGQDPTGFIATQIESFGRDFGALIQGIRSRAPNARIVVANVPSLALTPIGQQQPASARALLAAISLGINQRVINPLASQGIPVVDLFCDAGFPSRGNFFPGPFADGFHPNDTGYARLVPTFLSAIRSPTITPPQSSCPQAAFSLSRLDPAELSDLALPVQ